MDDATLIIAFRAHTAGANKFTRRMAITLAFMAGMTPRGLVRRLETMGLLRRGAWSWFVENGGITAAQVAEVRGRVGQRLKGKAA
jgi:hypothetical protein